MLTDNQKEFCFHQGIFSIVQTLHMSNTGTTDPLPEDMEKMYKEYLQFRLDNWKVPSTVGRLTTPTGSFKYDAAVMLLIEQVLMEKSWLEKNDKD